jgi:anti-sigma factor RsiW
MLRRALSKVMRPNLRKCEETRALMSEYLDGELDASGRKSVARHVRFCHRCHTVLANLRETLGRLRRLQDAEPPGAGDVESVRARIVRGWREHA